jgi:hypothetical protein
MLYRAISTLSPWRLSRRFIARLKKGFIVVMALLLPAAGLFAATPVLSRLELIGSGRGLALTLGADAAFGLTISERASEKSQTAVLSIKCSNVIYGLDEYQFTLFPRGAPLKQIVAKENKASGSVELLIKTLTPFDKNIRFKQKENRWVILLTSAPVNDFAWSAQNENQRPLPAGGFDQAGMTKSAPSANVRSGPPQATASSFLEDISILHRERVEKIVFKFDAPTQMIVKSLPEKIMVLFVNAKSGLSHGAFKSEKDWLVKSIDLKEVVHGGNLWLGASIFVNRDAGVKPLVQTFPDKLVIYSVCDAKQSLSLWSAKSGTTLSYAFISPQDFRVDLKKIESRALSDSKTDMGKTGTFSVKEPSPKAPQPGEEAPLPARTIRVVMKKDNVALRSTPSAAPTSSVVGHLPFGALATQLEKKGPWICIESDGVRGWIAAALAMDSVRVPRALWEKIEAEKIASVKREEKLREAERIRQEKKTRQEQLTLARQKAVEEKKEKARETERISHEEKTQQERFAAARQTGPQNQKGQPAQAAAQPAPIEKMASAFASSSPPAVLPVHALDNKEAAVPQPTAAAAVVPEKPLQNLIEYKVYGRDPFLPLNKDEEGPLPNVENLQIVGILYDRSARIALLEDISEKGNAYALRENDPVKNGYLLRIEPDRVLFLLNEFGISRTFAMRLIKDKASENAFQKNRENPRSFRDFNLPTSPGMKKEVSPAKIENQNE